MIKYVADFETTTHEDDKTRVWAYGICEIGNTDNFQHGTNIQDFMMWCKRQENAIVYFHNLKFDGEFILHWLLNNGYEYSEKKKTNTFNCIISNTGQFYGIEVIYKKKKKSYLKTTFYDSLKKLPFPAETIAKGFDLPIRKLDLDYHKARDENHVLTDDELDYIRNDVEIIARALDIQFKEGLERMTVGSDALNWFKEEIGGKEAFEKRFPILPLRIDADIRQAYKGGFTYVADRYKGKDVQAGIVYDVNSLYPSVMYNRFLPFGRPVFFKGKYKEDPTHPLYIQKFTAEFRLKKDKIPTVQVKGNLRFVPTEYVHHNGDEPTTLIMTNVDLELFKEQYDILDIEYHNGWKFKQCKGVFNDYIDYWMNVKVTETGAKKTLAKLMLNALYGKFATNPDITGKYPVLTEDNTVKYKLKEPETRDPVYTPMGAFITAWARDLTIRTAQSNYDRFIYADTDSIHLEGTEPPDIDVHESRIGAWKHEGTFTRARFVRAKSYVEEFDGQLHVTCAGMPDRIKEDVTWENFHRGFTSDKKLKPKHVVGGIKLVDSPFTLK